MNVTLVYQDPLTLSRKKNRSLRRSLSKKKLPLAHLLHVMGEQIIDKKSVRAFQENFHKNHCRERARTSFSVTSLLEDAKICMFLAAICLGIEWLSVVTGSIDIVFTAFVFGMASLKGAVLCRRKATMREETIYRDLLLKTGWKRIPFPAGRFVPAEVCEVVTEACMRDSEVVAFVERFDKDPFLILFHTRSKEEYIVKHWDEPEFTAT